MGRNLEIPWRYPVVDTTEDRRVAQASVPGGLSVRLTGVDGSLKGGLRPFPGFLKAYELDFYSWADHDESSEVIDLFPIDFRRLQDSFAFGFVYRAVKSEEQGLEALSDVFLDYYDRTCQQWFTGKLLMSDVDPAAQMDVVASDRRGFVFAEGRSPVLFYLTDRDPLPDPPTSNSSSSSSSSSSSASQGCELTLEVLGADGVNDLPGPGKQPTLRSPENSIGLGNILTTGNARRPGAGQVVLTDLSPAQSGLFPGL